MNSNEAINVGDESQSTFSLIWRAFYKYFLRYFLHQEIGQFWAVINGLIATFWLGFLSLYLMKPWGFTAWNRNLIKNKKRFREIGFRRVREELADGEDQKKLEKRQQISDLNFAELRKTLQNGEITAVDAVDAFRWKALMVQEKYNCVTEFVKEAMENAAELDEKYKGKPKPPLFGMPFSVKENFFMKGYDCTCGLAKNIEEKMTETCSFVVHLQTLGAVPIVRTNVPQALLSFVCSNLIFGTTLNPNNTKRAGGSSGGEGCIIAAGGCPFGVGSDLAGSLRIPAHFCGIATLKPSSGRFKVSHAQIGIPGVAKMGLSYGFFAKDAETITYLTSLTFVREYFDANPLTCPIPFRPWAKTEEERRPLRVGYFVDDGWLEPVPACKRAVERAAAVLESLGHHSVPFTVPEPYETMQRMMKAMFPDNAACWRKSVEYEDIDPLLKPTALMLRTPLWLRRIASKLMYKWPQMSLSANGFVRDLDDLRRTYGEIDEYAKKFADQWTNLKLDALICPVMPFPAIPHEFPSKLGVAVFSTGLFNMLDYPAGVVPMTVVDAEDDRKLSAEYPKRADGRPVENFTVWDNPVYATIRQAAAESAGLPVGVQIAALPYQEEKCLRVMEILDRHKSSV